MVAGHTCLKLRDCDGDEMHKILQWENYFCG